METFSELDKAAAEKMEKLEQYARYGIDYEKLEQAEAESKLRLAKIGDLLNQYALSIWKAAWMMMAEEYENTEEGIEAFCAAHGNYKKVVR